MMVNKGDNDLKTPNDEIEEDTDEEDDKFERGRRRRRKMSIPAEMQLPEGSTKYTRRGRGVKKPGEAFQELLAYLMNLLIKKDTNKWFSVPMNDRIAPGYSKTVKEPMDFTTMENNLDTHGYSTLKEMKYDFELICENAMAFNKPDTGVYRAAKRLKVYGLQMLSKTNLREIVKERPTFSSLTKHELGFEIDDTDDEDMAILFDDDSYSQSDSAIESIEGKCKKSVQNTKRNENKGPGSEHCSKTNVKGANEKKNKGSKRKETPNKLDDKLGSKSNTKSSARTPQQKQTKNFRKKETKQESPNLTYKQTEQNFKVQTIRNNSPNLSSDNQKQSDKLTVKTWNAFERNATPNTTQRLHELKESFQNDYGSWNQGKSEKNGLTNENTNLLEMENSWLNQSTVDGGNAHKVLDEENRRGEDVIDEPNNIDMKTKESDDNVDHYQYSEETYVHKKFGKRNVFQNLQNEAKM